MSFDDEIDAARERLKKEIASETAPSVNDAETLQRLLPQLRAKIASRRLRFNLSEDPEDPGIDIAHVETEEVLGYIYSEDGEYVFESSLEDYFHDLVDEDAESFLFRLYETLRADLPKYEVENQS
jgi:hypothetical protein